MEETTNSPSQALKVNFSPIMNQRGEIIILREKTTTHFVELEHITHLTCDCYLTSVYSNDGEHIVIAKLLKDFENDLEKYGFIRINRNTIVNYFYIKIYERGGNRMIHLRNNITVKTSRRGIIKLKTLLES